jgi:hypothetical protein
MFWDRLNTQIENYFKVSGRDIWISGIWTFLNGQQFENTVDTVEKKSTNAQNAWTSVL